MRIAIVTWDGYGIHSVIEGRSMLHLPGGRRIVVLGSTSLNDTFGRCDRLFTLIYDGALFRAYVWTDFIDQRGPSWLPWEYVVGNK